MAVKKTSKTTSKTTAAKRKSTKKTAAKKATVTKKVAAKPKTKTVRKTKPAAVKKATSAKTVSSAKPAQNTFALPILDFKEMETIMTKQPFQFDQIAQEAANQSRESVEAFVKSGTIFAKGFEEIIKTAAGLTQNVAQKQAEFANQLMSSKTLNEYAEAQNKIAQSNFDEFMAGATKLSEMSVKVLSEASEPINTQVTKAVQKANKAMAA